MKILFLGTGAADWSLASPGDGKDYRRFSSVLIDRTLLIDPGPQVPDALHSYGIDPTEIKYILNTHTHSDHYSAQTAAALEKAGAQFTEMRAGDSKALGKYTVYAYGANHSTCPDAVHFIITDSKSGVFYGLDGAWLLYDEVKGIQQHRPELAILDATVGFKDGDYRIFEHNNLAMVLELKKSLQPYVEQFCISHMAYTLHTEHGELSRAMEKEGILTAFDGLEIEV